MVLRAGTFTSLGSRRRRRSRILRAPQWGFSRLTATMAASICSGSWVAYRWGAQDRYAPVLHSSLRSKILLGVLREI